MKTKLLFLLFLFIDLLMLSYEASTLSISYHEAKLLYSQTTFTHYFITFFLDNYGYSDQVFRNIMIVLHILTVLLFYKISKPYVSRGKDRLWLIVIFMLLPGTISSALLVDVTGIVMLLLFLYIYVFQNFRKYHFLLLVTFVLVDISFAFLYLGIFFFALSRKSIKLLLGSTLLFALTLYIHGFNTSGTPEGHFLDTLGIYIGIFSPIVFIYIFYILYKQLFTKNRDLLWYIAVTALTFSLLLSFRQRIEVQMFAPFVMLAIPLATKSFFNSYRVRLKEFRKKYKTIFFISFLLLIINALVLMFNQQLYGYTVPQKHFAYRVHVAKELAGELQKRKIECIDMNSNQMQIRLKFYDIELCDRYIMLNKEIAKSDSVTIRYNDKIVYQKYVSKVHK
ncbi:MAG: hypothetical protein GQ570_11295 [Helicobacteraceae bacterium]|nr:hypothetical protein [Helicobacteraceae bacterium]